MRNAARAFAVLLGIGVVLGNVNAQGQSTTPFVSSWNDFKTVVPDGWTATYDFESLHYADTELKSGDPTYRFVIRWFTKYSTHMTVSGLLEMYADADDFVGQYTDWYKSSAVIDPPHPIQIGEIKAQRFVTRMAGNTQSISDISNFLLNRRSKLGKLVDSDVARQGGRQAWTVIPALSGFYVLAYFAPEDGFSRYEPQYEQMVSSFVMIKDGPNGGTLPGFTAVQDAPAQILQRYVSQINAQSGAPLADPDSHKELFQYVATMQPPPAIPDEAQRAFVQGNVIMQSAQNADDYKLAIDKYMEALRVAPWLGNAYANLGTALNAAGRQDEAKLALQIYLLTKPEDAGKAQAKIYEIEARQQLAADRKRREEDVMKAKYGNSRGGFSYDDLYRHGAIVQNMSFDASGNQRTLSLKISTRKENGQLVNYLIIYDITNPDDTFNQKFSINWRGTDNIYLDDRTQPYKDHLILSITSVGEDARISIRPADNASASIEANLIDIFRERARQAIYNGDVTLVGSRKFFVLGQGGSIGSLAYFPEEIKDKVDRGAALDLVPMFVANVTHYDSSQGTTVRFNNPDLGILDGTPYHLEFNGSYWDAKVGPGFEQNSGAAAAGCDPNNPLPGYLGAMLSARQSPRRRGRSNDIPPCPAVPIRK